MAKPAASKIAQILQEPTKKGETAHAASPEGDKERVSTGETPASLDA